jgi:hypothetical protein
MHESPVFRVIIIKKVIYTYLKKKNHSQETEERERGKTREEEGKGEVNNYI